MKLWSIQTDLAWKRLRDLGTLQSDRALVDSYFVGAYQWLVEQMRQRIGPPPPGVEYPMWAWVQYDGVGKPRPDLRHAEHLLPGEPGVLLEYECPAQEVLRSDYDTWHYVLNNWYLPSDGADEQAFRGRWRSLITKNPDAAAAKQASWQRIFDLDWCDPKQDYASPREAKRIQGSLWELRLNQVKSVRPFVARGRRREVSTEATSQERAGI